MNQSPCLRAGGVDGARGTLVIQFCSKLLFYTFALKSPSGGRLINFSNSNLFYTWKGQFPVFGGVSQAKFNHSHQDNDERSGGGGVDCFCFCFPLKSKVGSGGRSRQTNIRKRVKGETLTVNCAENFSCSTFCPTKRNGCSWFVYVCESNSVVTGLSNCLKMAAVWTHFFACVCNARCAYVVQQSAIH